MTQVNFGDVIYVKRDCGIFGYKHFGVYSGNGNVIHYVKAKAESDVFKGVIRETSLTKFLDGDSDYYICSFDSFGRQINSNSSHDPKTVSASLKEIYDLTSGERPRFYSPEETVARARSRLDTRGYDLLLNNCEHFAVWCKTNLAKSEQVEKVILSVAELVEEPLIKAAIEPMTKVAVEAAEPFVESALKTVSKFFPK